VLRRIKAALRVRVFAERGTVLRLGFGDGAWKKMA
jgi:hypothetical protein